MFKQILYVKDLPCSILVWNKYKERFNFRAFPFVAYKLLSGISSELDNSFVIFINIVLSQLIWYVFVYMRNTLHNYLSCDFSSSIPLVNTLIIVSKVLPTNETTNNESHSPVVFYNNEEFHSSLLVYKHSPLSYYLKVTRAVGNDRFFSWLDCIHFHILIPFLCKLRAALIH